MLLGMLKLRNDRHITLYTLTSVCIFPIMFSINFLRCWRGEFVEQSRAFFPLVIIPFLLVTLNVLFRGYIVGRNLTLVTLRDLRVKHVLNYLAVTLWLKRTWLRSIPSITFLAWDFAPASDNAVVNRSISVPSWWLTYTKK